MKKFSFKNILTQILSCLKWTACKLSAFAVGLCKFVVRNKYKLAGVLAVLALLFALHYNHNKSTDGKGTEIDIPHVVMHHLADDYVWHFATVNDFHLEIHLPVIIRSAVSGEWHFCTTNSLPDGFYQDSDRHGKIYETAPDGTSVRPLDLSITKLVAQLMLTVIVLLVVFTTCASWYKKRDESSPAPKGFVGVVETLVMYIHDEVIRPCVGEHHYKKYAGFLLTVFFFIFTTNILGLIPGAANVTGNINVTFFLALATMLAINLFGNKVYWKEILNPDVPWWLKVPIPLMPAIELFGIFSKPFALMIRLFANMMAGHAVMLSFTCVIFFGTTLGVSGGGAMNIFGVVMLLFMYALEVLVAFVQAYVFTLLSSVFIGLAHVEHHE